MGRGVELLLPTPADASSGSWAQSQVRPTPPCRPEPHGERPLPCPLRELRAVSRVSCRKAGWGSHACAASPLQERGTPGLAWPLRASFNPTTQPASWKEGVREGRHLCRFWVRHTHVSRVRPRVRPVARQDWVGTSARSLALVPQFPALLSCHLRGAPGTELVSEEELVRVTALEQGLVP